LANLAKTRPKIAQNWPKFARNCKSRPNSNCSYLISSAKLAPLAAHLWTALERHRLSCECHRLSCERHSLQASSLFHQAPNFRPETRLQWPPKCRPSWPHAASCSCSCSFTCASAALSSGMEPSRFGSIGNKLRKLHKLPSSSSRATNWRASVSSFSGRKLKRGPNWIILNPLGLPLARSDSPASVSRLVPVSSSTLDSQLSTLKPQASTLDSGRPLGSGVGAVAFWALQLEPEAQPKGASGSASTAPHRRCIDVASTLHRRCIDVALALLWSCMWLAFGLAGSQNSEPKCLRSSGSLCRVATIGECLSQE